MFAADSADVSHVPAVAANGQSALAGDFPLLLGAHGGETATALFLTAGRAGGAAGRLAALSGTSSLGPTTGASTL